jgi:TRAF3-interacting protein 1
MIDLDIAVKRPPDVRVSKILAGQEADKTNLLLQALAEAIDSNVDNNEVIRKTLQSVGETNENEEPARSQDQKEQERSERHRSKEERSSKSREREHEREREEPPPPPPPPSEKKSSSRDGSRVKLK